MTIDLPITQGSLYFRFRLEAHYELDLSVFGLTAARRLEDENYFVFYNQQSSPERAIRLLPSAQGEYQAAVSVAALPDSVSRLVFAVSCDQPMPGPAEAQLTILGSDKIELHWLSIPVDNVGQSAILCEAIRSVSGWQVTGIGRGCPGDLSDLLESLSKSPVSSEVKQDDDNAETIVEERQSIPESTPISLPMGRLSPQDFEVVSRITELARRVSVILPQLQTEEATKHSLVMPLLQALGYDVFNPLEVTPELTADVGIKKGEKVDYAILRDGKPTILIECKHHDVVPSPENASQLYRYFSVTEARFALLTNGLAYRFYTDLEKPNVMDKRPFLEVNLLDLKESELNELLKFAKHKFDQDDILSLASEMKYIKAIKQHIAQEFDEPTDEFIRFLTGRVFDGRLTTTVRNRFSLYTKKALNEFVAQMISERLRDAFEQSEKSASAGGASNDGEEEGLPLSPEEWQGFYMVRSMLREHVDYSRLHIRKHQSYSAVLLDNNRRRTICRFYFTDKRLLLGLMDKERQETKVALKGLDDLFKHADKLIQTTKMQSRVGHKS